LAVENSGSLISDLDDTLPRPDDYISEGDDHIRLIKHSLQYTFPNIEAVVTPTADKLNQMDSYLEFTTSNGNPKVNFQNPTILSNGLNAVAGTDYPVLQQVKDLITTALQNSVYRVGSYYISDDATNPLQVLGFGTWVRVSGFIAGAGSVSGGGGVASRTLTAGTSGGSHAYKLTSSQIPQISKDMATSGIRTSHVDNHVHGGVAPLTGAQFGGNTDAATNPYQSNGQTAPAGAHEHDLVGTLTIGNANPDQIDNMPPFTVANIWKRTA
jgi:hypothetical protein